MSEGPAEDDALESDWNDQDLLTVDLAAQRLFEEIDQVRRQIAEAGPGPDDAAAVTAAKQRLELLVAASRRFRRPTP